MKRAWFVNLVQSAGRSSLNERDHSRLTNKVGAASSMAKFDGSREDLLLYQKYKTSSTTNILWF